MYDDLVKRLRECASGECFNCSQYTEITNASVCQKELMKQAADAIEELAAFKASITEGYFYCMRDGVLYEAKVESPSIQKAKSIQLPPIEFAEPPKEENYE